MIVSETPRLILKHFSIDDVDGLYELNNDPQVIKYTQDVAFKTKAQVQQFIQSYNHYKKHGYGRWSVYLKETHVYVGFCGLRYDNQFNEVDIGFRFMRKYWHQGIAYESAFAAIQLGFEQFNINRIVARAMESNTASHALIKKLGMTYHSSFYEGSNKWTKYELFTTIKTQ